MRMCVLVIMRYSTLALRCKVPYEVTYTCEFEALGMLEIRALACRTPRTSTIFNVILDVYISRPLLAFITETTIISVKQW